MHETLSHLNVMTDEYFNKYIKYKTKYTTLKNQHGGSSTPPSSEAIDEKNDGSFVDRPGDGKNVVARVEYLGNKRLCNKRGLELNSSSTCSVLQVALRINGQFSVNWPRKQKDEDEYERFIVANQSLVEKAKMRIKDGLKFRYGHVRSLYKDGVVEFDLSEEGLNWLASRLLQTSDSSTKLLTVRFVPDGYDTEWNIKENVPLLEGKYRKMFQSVNQDILLSEAESLFLMMDPIKHETWKDQLLAPFRVNAEKGTFEIGPSDDNFDSDIVRVRFYPHDDDVMSLQMNGLTLTAKYLVSIYFFSEKSKLQQELRWKLQGDKDKIKLVSEANDSLIAQAWMKHVVPKLRIRPLEDGTFDYNGNRKVAFKFSASAQDRLQKMLGQKLTAATFSFEPTGKVSASWDPARPGVQDILTELNIGDVSEQPFFSALVKIFSERAREEYLQWQSAPTAAPPSGATPPASSGLMPLPSVPSINVSYGSFSYSSSPEPTVLFVLGEAYWNELRTLGIYKRSGVELIKVVFGPGTYQVFWSIDATDQASLDAFKRANKAIVDKCIEVYENTGEGDTKEKYQDISPSTTVDPTLRISPNHGSFTGVVIRPEYRCLRFNLSSWKQLEDRGVVRRLPGDNFLLEAREQNNHLELIWNVRDDQKERVAATNPDLVKSAIQYLLDGKERDVEPPLPAPSTKASSGSTPTPPSGSTPTPPSGSTSTPPSGSTPTPPSGSASALSGSSPRVALIRHQSRFTSVHYNRLFRFLRHSFPSVNFEWYNAKKQYDKVIVVVEADTRYSDRIYAPLIQQGRDLKKPMAVLILNTTGEHPSLHIGVVTDSHSLASDGIGVAGVTIEDSSENELKEPLKANFKALSAFL